MDKISSQPCTPMTESVKAVFSFLTPDEVGVLCQYLELKEWEAEQVVMREHEREDYMGFVVEGKLAVKKQTGFRNKYIIIALLDKGTMVGEGAFIDQGPRSSTVVAMEKSRLLILTTGKMEELTGVHPELAIKLLKRILHIISLRLRKAGDRIAQLL